MRKVQGLVHIVGHQDNCHGQLIGQILQPSLQVRACHGIQRAEGLIEQQQPWTSRRGTQDRHTLGLSTG